MSSVQTIDNSPDHLYPEFRTRLGELFTECKSSGVILKIGEGYRSQERQLYLYCQGRPGTELYHPGVIVTDNQESKYHGAGIAADCYPVNVAGKMVYEFTDSQLHTFRSLMPKYGLIPTKFPGDYGHVQLNCPESERLVAQTWCTNGFQLNKPTPTPTPSSPTIPGHGLDVVPIGVFINGKEIPGVGGHLNPGGHVVAWARPILEALQVRIDGVLTNGLVVGTHSITLPAIFTDNRAFIELTSLRMIPDIKISLSYDSTKHEAQIQTTN